MQIYSVQSYHTNFQAKGGKAIKQIANKNKVRTDFWGIPLSVKDEFAEMGVSHAALVDFFGFKKSWRPTTATVPKMLKTMRKDPEWCEDLKCRVPSSKEAYEKQVFKSLKYGGFEDILENDFDKLIKNPKVFADLVYKGIIEFPRLSLTDILHTLSAEHDSLIKHAIK